MSGGYFDYYQYYIDQIAQEVESLIENKEEAYEEYSEEVIREFRKGLKVIKKAFIYAQRIDWLVCADDSEESFLKYLKRDLSELEGKFPDPPPIRIINEDKKTSTK